MDAKVYVYGYLLLAIVYAAACMQYLATVSKTRRLAQGLAGEAGAPALDSEETVEQAKTTIRAILGIESSAFACAVLPVAYLGVTGLLANFVSRNTAAAPGLNLVWLVATVALVAAHMFFVVRIVALNARFDEFEAGVLSPSFVGRHTSILNYYILFVLAVTAFNVLNIVWMIANISKVTQLPFVM
jgi:hypothetical protein